MPLVQQNTPGVALPNSVEPEAAHCHRGPDCHREPDYHTVMELELDCHKELELELELDERRPNLNTRLAQQDFRLIA